MTTNLLKALINLQKVKNFSLPAHYGSANRMNSMGVALEYFVKDAFCNSLQITNTASKDKEYSKYLSYIGNANNPPDFMINGGDAVEVKKVQSPNSGLALNSSYPKNKLYSNNPLLTNACRQCERWSEKDIIYTVGVVRDKKISLLWFIYGDCYMAESKVYKNVRNKIIKGIQTINTIDFSKTKELGRVNRVDPLGITYLRIRGMWGIENPTKVFNYLSVNEIKKPSVIALMRKEKFDSFPDNDKKIITRVGNIKDVDIKDPNNPAKFIKAKIIQL